MQSKTQSLTETVINLAVSITHKGITHKNCKLSKCGKYYIASNNFTKFKIEKCKIL